MFAALLRAAQAAMDATNDAIDFLESESDGIGESEFGYCHDSLMSEFYAVRAWVQAQDKRANYKPTVWSN